MVTPLPGAVGLSGLRVYEWATADGVCGGSPHVHLTCSESYVVVAGSGRVQTLTAQGFAETALLPGMVAWFTPGTIHRLVNDGDLRIVVIMQNSGLPEAGDAVFTFPPAILADPDAYAEAASLTSSEGGHADDEDAARRRRDLAIEGFLELRERTGEGDHTALTDFYQAAVRLKHGLFDDWEQRWRTGALAAAHETGGHLTRLRAGDFSHLTDADIQVLEPPSEQRLGMCGHLDVYAASAGKSPHSSRMH